ncbi:MAG: 23S rRNA (guanosine(2251)-2'-O)-methyltransferase RlmB [Clostridiales bacterium]|nr:23S rRNA (guanosine(2251)-2'-O)-methyltransferase RlmB [Clostridiales bacterium]
MSEMKNNGEDLLIGRNPVLEALRSGREIDMIFIQNNGTDGPLGRILGLAKEKRVTVRRVPKAKLDELARPFNKGNTPANHQGVAAKVALVKYASLDDIFARAEEKGEKPFIIACDGITDPHNLGAIVRSAEVFGAHGVVIPKNRSASMNGAAVKAACGAEEYIPVAKVGNLAQALDELKERGVFLACADMDGVRADKLDLSGAICLVIGSEGEGVSKLVREKCDHIVRIDVLGKIDSLNASCAAAVLMYEKRRQTGN